MHQLVTHGGFNPTLTASDAKVRRERLLVKCQRRIRWIKLRCVLLASRSVAALCILASKGRDNSFSNPRRLLA
jgi:hypothetical protein